MDLAAESHAAYALLRLLVRHMVHHSVIKSDDLASDLALLCEQEAATDPDAAALLRQVLDELG